MGCCNETSAALTQSGQNPALHVNYTKGMVLGVDDFTQEFSYLSNRDQWAVRELLGYGTTSGLAVVIEDAGVDGPRVHVKRGAAVVPSGRLVCVPNDQCALINQWLTKPENAEKINKLLPLPANDGKVFLFLTLCYKDCTAIPVPIPGDPCRSEDKLMADSRIADDYYLEIRTEAEAPPQTEEDAARDFVTWLKQHVSISDTAADEKIWIKGLTEAIQPWIDAVKENPAKSAAELYESLKHYLVDGSTPIILPVKREQLSQFLRLAFRFWVIELRPLWTARLCGTFPGSDDECLLLARLEVPVIRAGGTPAGAWQVDGTADVIIADESMRPYLAHMRLLQEWLLCNSAPEQVLGLTPGTVSIAITSTSTDLTLNASHYCIVCNDGPTLTLPKCGADNQGRIYIVKSINKDSTIKSQAGNLIDDEKSKVVAAKKAITLVSDGLKTWHVIAVA
ncbi:hypothetical protein Nit79A3_1016 [Nitrosomonas sp. Is79A3]|uniref:hypothetical protein n=1 Tax=Nitrosomonas sp. (strain Is79A3) TaxID=261292 RepID=UPI000215C749